jgi:hypothetical protein
VIAANLYFRARYLAPAAIALRREPSPVIRRLGSSAAAAYYVDSLVAPH